MLSNKMSFCSKLNIWKIGRWQNYNETKFQTIREMIILVSFCWNLHVHILRINTIEWQKRLDKK